MIAEIPKIPELLLAAGEETPAVTKLHTAVLTALAAQDLPGAQRLTADLLDQLELHERREPILKTRRLIEFVLLLS